MTAWQIETSRLTPLIHSPINDSGLMPACCVSVCCNDFCCQDIIPPKL
jgi:hypothetical protein